MTRIERHWFDTFMPSEKDSLAIKDYLHLKEKSDDKLSNLMEWHI